MKKIIALTCLFFAFQSSAQLFNTGDAELDVSLKIVNDDANKSLPTFKLELTKTFSTTLPKVDLCFKAGMLAADVYFAFELARITKKPIDDVVVVYKKSKSKGWGVMAKELGIKPGSAAFKELKGNCKSKSTKGKANKAAPANVKKEASPASSGASKGNGAKKK